MYIDISDVHALPTYDNNLYANLLLGDTITDLHPPPTPPPSQTITVPTVIEYRIRCRCPKHVLGALSNTVS